MSGPIPAPASARPPTSTPPTPWPETPNGIFRMFLKNLYTMTLFMSANLSLIMCWSLLHKIWDRNFGVTKDPFLWYFCSIITVLGHSTLAFIFKEDKQSHTGRRPSLLVATAWAFSLVFASLGGLVLAALAAEWVAISIGITGV